MNQTISGDYYCLGKQGEYKKHVDVTVHCLPSNNNSPQNKSHSINSTYPQKYEIPRTSSVSLLKSPLLQGCNKILEKEQVNSIHEQQETSIKGHEFKNISSFSQRKDNIKSSMRRSIQNQVHPKKGILKRSLIDSNENYTINYNGFVSQNNQIKGVNQPIKCHPSVINQYKNKKNQAELNPQQQIQQFSSVQTRKCQVSYSARPSRQEKQRHQQKPKLLRSHTQEIDTVAISQANNQANYNGEGFQDGPGFREQICQQIEFLKTKVKQFQLELKDSQYKMKEYTLARQLKVKQAQIQSIRQQNQTARQRCEKCEINRINIKKSDISLCSGLDIEHIIKWAQNNSILVAVFLLIMFACICLGKSSATCKV